MAPTTEHTAGARIENLLLSPKKNFRSPNPSDPVPVRSPIPGERLDYWILSEGKSEGGVIDCYPAGSPDDYLFDEAQPLAEQFPTEASVKFSRNFPQFRKLEDFQPNTMGALIVSPRVRRSLDGLGVENAEYLPVAVKDHKGEIVAPDYAILNLIGSEPAIDMEASVVDMDDLDEDQIHTVKTLVLDHAAISPDVKIFRCTTRRLLYMIRDDVKTAFEKAGLTGYRLFAAEGWNGKDY
jgi:hypothetical protein